ncbi:MAG: hypothetical protein AAB518_03800 [Patescibacteria group bacterium]
MIRLSVIVASVLLLVVIGVQAYRLAGQKNELETQALKLDAEAKKIREENQGIESDLGYYANPENLMKEFRSLFNYRMPSEELHIIVPKP